MTIQPVVLFSPTTAADHAAIAAIQPINKHINESTQTERNLQTQIGLSEYGTDCMYCLCMALAERNPVELESGWKPFVGTLIHAHLEQSFAKVNERNHPGWETGNRVVPTDQTPFYHLERKVWVDEYKTLKLGGSCDMFIEGASFGIVDDWKTQGPTVLKKTAVGKLPDYYIGQMHGYGFGYELLGYNVTHVMLWALPRDGELHQMVPVLMRYNRQIVTDRLALIHNYIDVAEMLGWDAVIAQQTSAKGCYNCLKRKTGTQEDWVSKLTGAS